MIYNCIHTATVGVKELISQQCIVNKLKRTFTVVSQNFPSMSLFFRRLLPIHKHFRFSRRTTIADCRNEQNI